MALVSFAASIFVVKNLGPSEFGIFQELTAYFLIAQNFENILNANIFKRKLIEDPESTHDMIVTHGLFVIGIGVLFTAAAALAYWLLALPDRFLLLPIMMSAMIFRYSNGITFYFDAELKTVKAQISLNVGNLVAAIYRVFISFTKPFALFQAIAMPLQYFVTMLIHLIQYRRSPHSRRGVTLRFAEYFALIAASSALFLSTFVDLVQGRLPLIYLGATVNTVDLGFFSAGLKLTEPWIFVASALSTSFWPKLVRANRESPEHFRQAASLYFASVFYFFSAIALVALMFSGFFIHQVLGDQYAGSETIFKIQAIVLLFQALNVAFGIVEISRGLTHISLIRNICSLGVTFVVLVVFVPRFGIEAASIAMLCSTFAACVLCPLLFPQTRAIVALMLGSVITGPQNLIQHLRRH